jgi:hypothetical protein
LPCISPVWIDDRLGRPVVSFVHGFDRRHLRGFRWLISTHPALASCRDRWLAMMVVGRSNDLP